MMRLQPRHEAQILRSFDAACVHGLGTKVQSSYPMTAWFSNEPKQALGATP